MGVLVLCFVITVIYSKIKYGQIMKQELELKEKPKNEDKNLIKPKEKKEAKDEEMTFETDDGSEA